MSSKVCILNPADLRLISKAKAACRNASHPGCPLVYASAATVRATYGLGVRMHLILREQQCFPGAARQIIDEHLTDAMEAHCACLLWIGRV